MPLGFSANVIQLPSLSSHGKLSQAFNTLVRAAVGMALACLLTAAFCDGPAVAQSNTPTVTEDQTRPTVSIDGPTQPQRGAFWVSIAFSESVEGFEQSDVTVGNGFVRKFTGSGASYRAEVRITPGYSGTVTVDVGANAAAAADGDGNLAANRYSVEGDQSRPTTSISGPSGVQAGAFEVTVTFRSLWRVSRHRT